MFYFDAPLHTSKRVVTLLLQLLCPDRNHYLLFGTDFPDTPDAVIDFFRGQLETYDTITTMELHQDGINLFLCLK